MEKKIEKMGHFLVPSSTSEGVVDALRSLADKLNEIIDHLNSQAQPEIFKELSDKNIRDDIPEGFVEINGKLHKMEDTPEQKEEWEKRFIRTFGYWGEEIKFIKQLLKERERWAIDTFLKDTASYNSFHNGRPRTMRNGLSGEGFEVRVSKLSKKK